MKKLLNTLYITNKKTYLSREGETVLVTIEKQRKHQFPIHLLEGIVCFGNVMCTPSLMHLCALKNVAISFLNDRGRFLAKVQGPVSGNVLLRREQYRRADDPDWSEKVARAVILGKITNSRTVLMRAARECQNEDVKMLLINRSSHLVRLAQSLINIRGVDSLRGIREKLPRAIFQFLII